MKDLKELEVWFAAGSQHLYGGDVLKKVDENSAVIAGALSASRDIPVRVVKKPVMTMSADIHKLIGEANSSPNCIGFFFWMHTFSPARMWISGLRSLRKPFVHLHTQFNKSIPWAGIDMDFMNLNQSAHGGREFGYMASRMGVNRKVVAGHWEDGEVLGELGVWARAAAGFHDSAGAKIARFGDNMRNVAVTEGDKVEAQILFGYEVNGYGVGELAERVSAVPGQEVDLLIDEYSQKYVFSKPLESNGPRMQALREAAAIEAGLRTFLEEGGFKAFTTTFENLHDLPQLPGLAVQRLMEEGYGFGAEGDWKTAALVRAMKVMGAGLKGGTSFMEDYTYHFGPGEMKVLGAHMLEVCPSIASGKPSLELHPLSIGGKPDPVRLVFTAEPGPAVNASIIDLGSRFRMVVNAVDVVEPEEDLPRLPVPRALWVPRPSLRKAAQAWILAGGAHHTGFSSGVSSAHLEDFAEMAGVEFLLIDEETSISGFKNQLRWNAAAREKGF